MPTDEWWTALTDELRRERDEARADLKQALTSLAMATSESHERRLAEAKALLEMACHAPSFHGLAK